MSDYLTRADIVAVPDLASEEVDVPEWGGKVLVQEMPGTLRSKYQASIVTFADDGTSTLNLDGAIVRLVAYSIVDPETRELYFGNGDAEVLGAKSGAALDRVFSVAQRLNSLGDAHVEETAGN